MDKVIRIDGRDVQFRATAAVPRLYRILFRRDILQDIAALQKEIKKVKDEGGDLTSASLEIFENVAYVMTRSAPLRSRGKVGWPPAVCWRGCADEERFASCIPERGTELDLCV